MPMQLWKNLNVETCHIIALDLDAVIEKVNFKTSHVIAFDLDAIVERFYHILTTVKTSR